MKLLPGRKLSRKNRNLVTGLLVAAAALYFVAYFLELSLQQLGSFFLATVLFVAGIILLAVVATAVFKGLGRLLRGGQDDEDRNSRQ